MTQEDLTKLVAMFEEQEHDLRIFMDGVSSWFDKHKQLHKQPNPIIHSVRSRLKDPGHLAEKIQRKSLVEPITSENLFDRITDLAGVRVLHLYQEQFATIHERIREKVEVQKDWVLMENPKAYTWDPESRSYFEGLGITTDVKDSYYTSVHYVIRPRKDSPLTCEIQVRTLFEEIWGEVDHSLNYPVKSSSFSCQEQLKVLAKVVGAGSRLVDSIYRSSSATAVGPVQAQKHP